MLGWRNLEIFPLQCKLFFVCLVASFLGIDLNKGSFTNYSLAEKAERKNGICSLNWIDDNESQVCW